MNKRNKVKAITSIICLVISVFALYSFVFVVDVSIGWRIALIIIALFWIFSGISNLIECFEKNK